MIAGTMILQPTLALSAGTIGLIETRIQNIVVGGLLNMFGLTGLHPHLRNPEPIVGQ